MDELKKQAIQRMLDQQKQHQQDLKTLDGSVFQTPGEALELKLQPENLALGMGIGGINSIGKSISPNLLESFAPKVEQGAKNVYSKLKGMISPNAVERTQPIINKLESKLPPELEPQYHYEPNPTEEELIHGRIEGDNMAKQMRFNRIKKELDERTKKRSKFIDQDTTPGIPDSN